MRGLVLAVALAFAAPAAGSELTPASVVRVETETLRLEFAARGARPVRWEACHPGCLRPRTRVLFNDLDDAPQASLALEGHPLLDNLPYAVERRDEVEAVVLAFRSQGPAGSPTIEKTWRIPRQGYRTTLDVSVHDDTGVGPARLELTAGRAFHPAPAPGFAGLGETVQPVSVSAAGAVSLDAEQQEGKPRAAAFEPGSWTGLRNRFWALLARAEAGGSAQASQAGDRVEVTLAPARSGTVRIAFYSGPIDRAELAAVDPELTRLLFWSQWFWMRWLCLGLLLLLDGIERFVGATGPAIVLLAFAVKVLMRPLTHLAERWQRQVNEIRSRLQPAIDDIKAGLRGEEQTRRIMKLYREEGVHPLYGLKSLFGVLVQIPIFIAAYHMLSEDFGLDGASFLWVRDLSRPDRVASLPFSIPFLGDALNLLPFVMTAVTIASSRLFDDGTLSPELLRRQRRSLYGMALLFFALFYTFPAGMVLYWTSNNVVQLLKEQASRWGSRRSLASPH